MWIDKKTLEWNPWDTDLFGKKRPSHIIGIRKMNEYHLQSTSQKRRSQGSQQGGGNIKFTQVSYKDPDMQMLATQNRGTTEAYDYNA